MSGFETVSRLWQGTHHIWHMLPMDNPFPMPCGEDYYFGIGRLSWNHGCDWKMASCGPYSFMLSNVYSQFHWRCQSGWWQNFGNLVVRPGWNHWTGPGHVSIPSSGDRQQIYEWQQLARGCLHWFMSILVHWIYEMTILLADTLSCKWSHAQEGVSETMEAFTQLTTSIETSSVQEWAAVKKVAMEQCGNALKIFEVQVDKCRWLDMQFEIGHTYKHSAHTGGYLPEIVQTRGPAWKPVGHCYHSFRRSCHRAVSVFEWFRMLTFILIWTHA